jgi:hypothetical protein
MSALFAARGVTAPAGIGATTWLMRQAPPSPLSSITSFGLRDRPKGNSRRIIESPDRACGDSTALVNQWNQRVLSAFL